MIFCAGSSASELALCFGCRKKARLTFRESQKAREKFCARRAARLRARSPSTPRACMWERIGRGDSRVLRRCEAAEAPAEAASANFFSYDNFGSARRIAPAQAILIHVASNAYVQNHRIKRHHRNPHSMGTFAPRRIFGRKSRHRESFWKGVSVSIASSARRHDVKRSLYTKLSGKDVFFALLV